MGDLSFTYFMKNDGNHPLFPPLKKKSILLEHIIAFLI
ncbi:hypothetical protein [Staphylococcus hominis]|nr:hypothetical protein [Staphylococcus hominis]MEB5792488.1 hypothetical protein [Staphylococcus hominis]